MCESHLHFKINKYTPNKYVKRNREDYFYHIKNHATFTYRRDLPLSFGELHHRFYVTSKRLGRYGLPL